MAWSTGNEITYLTNIGSHTVTPKNRQRCLEGYLAAAKRRVEWDKLDKDVIIKTAESLLHLEKQKG